MTFLADIPSGRVAIYVVTRHGLSLARRLREALGDRADVYYLARRWASAVDESASGWHPIAGSLREAWQETFARYHCHVPIFSIGAAVRLLAPLIQDKKSDPAVVAVDELGRFTIPILSGHLGGGNIWAETLASILDATAVITTASDLHDTLRVDLPGKHLGWKIAPASARWLTEVSGLVVDGRPVALVQLAGEPDFWPRQKPLPAGISYHTSYDSQARSCEAALVVTDRIDCGAPTRREEMPPSHLVILYHPATLVIGIGCDRGFPVQAMASYAYQTLHEAGLAQQSVRMIASTDLKKDEAGLIELARQWEVALHTFSAQELDGVTGVTHPSERVKSTVGTASVAEAAALAGASSDMLLVPKTIIRDETSGKHMTIAVARMCHPVRSDTEREIQS